MIYEISQEIGEYNQVSYFILFISIVKVIPIGKKDITICVFEKKSGLIWN